MLQKKITLYSIELLNDDENGSDISLASQNEGKQHTPNGNDSPRDEDMQDVQQRNDHIQALPGEQRDLLTEQASSSVNNQ